MALLRLDEAMGRSQQLLINYLLYTSNFNVKLFEEKEYGKNVSTTNLYYMQVQDLQGRGFSTIISGLTLMHTRLLLIKDCPAPRRPGPCNHAYINSGFMAHAQTPENSNQSQVITPHTKKW